MKKQIIFILTMLLASASSFAIEVEIDGLWYEVVSKTKEATVIEYKNSIKYSGKIVIPATVNYNNETYSVTSIGGGAFYGCSGLTSVTIPNSVTSIGGCAFSECSGLTSITIPNSVASIGEYAFEDCSGLTSITIPNSVTSIGGGAFTGTSWYNNQPDGLVYAGKVAYKYKGTMPNNCSIALNEGTLGITGYAFDGCGGLTSITIPNSVTSIGNYAFYNCSGLTSITIPNSVTSIGENAFDGSSWYNNQPDGLIYAGKVAYGYKGVIPYNFNIVLKDGTLGIGDYAFRNCDNISSITIPNSVTRIGNNSFFCCRGLSSITIPNSVTSIGNYAFSHARIF